MSAVTVKFKKDIITVSATGVTISFSNGNFTITNVTVVDTKTIQYDGDWDDVWPCDTDTVTWDYDGSGDITVDGVKVYKQDVGVVYCEPGVCLNFDGTSYGTFNSPISFSGDWEFEYDVLTKDDNIPQIIIGDDITSIYFIYATNKFTVFYNNIRYDYSLLLTENIKTNVLLKLTGLNLELIVDGVSYGSHNVGNTYIGENHFRIADSNIAHNYWLGSIYFAKLTDLAIPSNSITYTLNSGSTTTEYADEYPTDSAKALTYTNVAPEDWSECPERPMVFDVKTDNTGTSSDTEFSFVSQAGAISTDILVDWGDGSALESITTTGTKTHDYGVVGTYTVKVYGQGSVRFNGSGDEAKLTDFKAWGSFKLNNLYGMFQNASCLYSYNDIPNLSFVDDMSYFSFGGNFNVPVLYWNVSNIRYMYGVFWNNDSFNQDLSTWQIQNVISINYFLVTPGFSKLNYDLLLGAWSQLAVTPSLTFRVSAKFSDQASHDVLTNAPNLWTIIDGGYEP